MILSEYIALLQKLPADLDVLINRGEWGPVAVKESTLPAVTPVCAFVGGFNGASKPSWAEDFFPEATASDEDYIQKKVVLL
jgi:hypothetical protein